MDDFREWLSDNLRYFEVGGAILLVILLLIFGIRSCIIGRKAPSQEGTVSTNGGGDNTASSNVNSQDAAGTASNSLVTADADIVKLVTDYYTAWSNKDVRAVRALVDQLSPTEEPVIVNGVYGNYAVENVYMLNGLDENSKAVYAAYTYQRLDYDTPVTIPMLSTLYVTKDSEGQWKIVGDTSTPEITQLFKSAESQADVASLKNSRESMFMDVMRANPDLAALMNVSIDQGNSASGGSSSAEAGDLLRATADVNVRLSPSSDGELVGLLEEGTTVTKTGQEGEWIQISYDGETAYVFGQYLERLGNE